MSRETDDALRQAIAASLADQASQDADDDLRQALEASKQETPSEPPKDIDALTAQERDALTIDQLNGILKEVETTQPMVGERTGVREALGAEYADNPQRGFSEGIARLDETYASLRRVRKDGNCFYRAFLYRYLEELVQRNFDVPRPPTGSGSAGGGCAELRRIRTVAKDSKAALLKVGFEEIVVDSFWETFCELLDNLPETSPRRLHELMTEEGNNVTSVVWFLRMLTSGRIKAHADRFAPFIGDDFADVERFCQVEVEPVNVECDQVQIIALTRAEIKISRRRPTRGLISAAQALTEALGVAVAIEYLDASGAPSRVVFPDGGEPSVTLLYRPGHYDILYDR
tara:strand:+ start:97 stop:1128 length:1032 start_codon:yes stop_codon:yes gene_type:complete